MGTGMEDITRFLFYVWLSILILNESRTCDSVVAAAKELVFNNAKSGFPMKIYVIFFMNTKKKNDIKDALI